MITKKSLKKGGPAQDWMLPENRNNLAVNNHLFGWRMIKAGDESITGKEAIVGHVG